MKIGLYNIDNKMSNIPLMKISEYHKKQGDDVDWYYPIMKGQFDKVYASSIFNFSDKGYVNNGMICGGTGFDLTTKLPEEIEICQPDYSIIYFSRGCIRKCPFCCISKKEGNIYPVEPMNLNPEGVYILVMDNNFFANPEQRESIKLLKKWNQHVSITQGIDVRILTEEMAKALLSLKYFKQIYMAWDNPRDDINWEKIIKWIPAYRIAVYVLIGYWSTPEEDLYRVEKLRSLKIDPFVMCFDKHNNYQKDFARWVNGKAIFKSIPWRIYKKSRGFK